MNKKTFYEILMQKDDNDDSVQHIWNAIKQTQVRVCVHFIVKNILRPSKLPIIQYTCEPIEEEAGPVDLGALKSLSLPAFKERFGIKKVSMQVHKEPVNVNDGEVK